MATSAGAARSTTIDDAEVAHFSAMADEWWDPKGKFEPLHMLNPVRVQYLRDRIMAHFASQSAAHGQTATPLKNLSLVDIGCGGGLIAEPMARMGATVTAIDASATNINVASLHAERAGLTIDYQATTAEDLAASGQQFDVVFALEIIEHVADLAMFYDAITKLVKPGGLLVLSTLNRTAKSYAMSIIGAEYILRWLPRGTHTWRKFIRPSEMAAALTRRGYRITDTHGLIFRPRTWDFALDTKDLDVNYLMTATN